MNVNQTIETALKDFVNNKIWPMVCPEDSPPSKYIVYNPEIEEPGFFAEDEDQEWVQHMQVHLYTKENYVKIRKDIRKSLRAAGFIITGIVTMYDAGYHHLCFECSIEEEE